MKIDRMLTSMHRYVSNAKIDIHCNFHFHIFIGNIRMDENGKYPE